MGHCFVGLETDFVLLLVIVISQAKSIDVSKVHHQLVLDLSLWSDIENDHDKETKYVNNASSHNGYEAK